MQHLQIAGSLLTSSVQICLQSQCNVIGYRCNTCMAEIIGSRFHCPVCDVRLHIPIGHCMFSRFLFVFFVSSSLSSSREDWTYTIEFLIHMTVVSSVQHATPADCRFFTHQ